MRKWGYTKIDILFPYLRERVYICCSSEVTHDSEVRITLRGLRGTYLMSLIRSGLARCKANILIAVLQIQGVKTLLCQTMKLFTQIHWSIPASAWDWGWEPLPYKKKKSSLPSENVGDRGPCPDSSFGQNVHQIEPCMCVLIRQDPVCWPQTFLKVWRPRPISNRALLSPLAIQ